MYKSTPRSCECHLQVQTPKWHTQVSVQVSVLSAELQPKQAEEPGEMFTHWSRHKHLPWGGWERPVDWSTCGLQNLQAEMPPLGCYTCLCNRLWNNYQGHWLVDCKTKPAGGQCSVHFPEPSRLQANWKNIKVHWRATDHSTNTNESLADGEFLGCTASLNSALYTSFKSINLYEVTPTCWLSGGVSLVWYLHHSDKHQSWGSEPGSGWPGAGWVSQQCPGLGDGAAGKGLLGALGKSNKYVWMWWLTPCTSQVCYGWLFNWTGRNPKLSEAANRGSAFQLLGTSR